MGKIKRERQKYHLERAKSMNDLTTIKPLPLNLPLPLNVPLPNLLPEYNKLNSTSGPFTISDNLFKGIDIPLNLNKSLKDFDSKSIISTKSSFKDCNLKKKEKRTLRHEAFVRKLDVIQFSRKEMKARKKRQLTPITGDMQTLADALPSLADTLPSLAVPISSLERLDKKTAPVKKPAVVVKQKKSLLKAKQRKKVMLNDIAAFQNVLKGAAYKADPMGAMSNFVQMKIQKELMDE